MSDKPIFQDIFGVPWGSLPPVMQKHYAVRPNSMDRVTVEGYLTIRRGLWMRMLSPFLRMFGALIPYHGEHLPARVDFYSGPGSAEFHFDRMLRLPDGRDFHFHSRLVRIRDNDVIELMRFGLGWRSRYTINGGHIALEQVGFYWRVFGAYVPLPMGWIMGKVAAAEDVVDENRFTMWMNIVHPLFGEIYRYEGAFAVTAVNRG